MGCAPNAMATEVGDEDAISTGGEAMGVFNELGAGGGEAMDKDDIGVDRPARWQIFPVDQRKIGGRRYLVVPNVYIRCGTQMRLPSGVASKS